VYSGQQNFRLPGAPYELKKMDRIFARIDAATIHPGTLRLLVGPAVLVETKRRARSPAGGLVLKYRAVERLSAFLKASPPQLMHIIAINERTAQRRKGRGALIAEESDRLARVALVTQRAVNAIGDENQARNWLRETNRALRVRFRSNSWAPIPARNWWPMNSALSSMVISIEPVANLCSPGAWPRRLIEHISAVGDRRQ
jgi:uncharacterized protein (DUF2384 family)